MNWATSSNVFGKPNSLCHFLEHLLSCICQQWTEWSCVRRGGWKWCKPCSHILLVIGTGRRDVTWVQHMMQDRPLIFFFLTPIHTPRTWVIWFYCKQHSFCCSVTFLLNIGSLFLMSWEETPPLLSEELLLLSNHLTIFNRLMLLSCGNPDHTLFGLFISPVLCT